MPAIPSTKKDIPVTEAKARVIQLIADGYQIVPAMNAVGRKEATYLDWRKTDSEFRAQVDAIRDTRQKLKETGKPPVPDFDVFCERYLRQPLYPHQLRMWDVIEGREPRDMHDSMTYEPGYSNRVLINVPPDHAKSTTFTVNYSVWRIAKDPDVRIAIMCASQRLARQFLYEIKQKLTSPLYREMQQLFGPEGGWKDPDNSWSADAIYVKGKNTSDGILKDPTVEAHGWGATIYGARLDLIFMDDVVVTKNAGEHEKQMVVLDREVESRLPPEDEGGGKLVILGTRVAPIDLYRQLQEVLDADDERVWTYFRQPAVLDYGNGDSRTWVVLWPERWSGKSLAKRKRGDAQWNLIYQQLNVSDNMTFNARAVAASINHRRFPGVLKPTAMGHRPEGMSGLYVIGGLDPATVNYTSMIVWGVNPTTGKRYVLDGFNMKACPPQTLRETVMRFTDTYHIHEWVIERNAFQRFLTQDPELTRFLRSRGCKLTEHYTTDNKYDSDFGIATMGPLFDSCGHPDPQALNGPWVPTPETALIELPSARQNSWVAELIQQLTTWEPQGMSQKAKTDLVMAMWFCEIAAKRILDRGQNKLQYRDNPFTNRAAVKARKVINLADVRRRLLDESLGVASG